MFQKEQGKLTVQCSCGGEIEVEVSSAALRDESNNKSVFKQAETLRMGINMFGFEQFKKMLAFLNTSRVK